MYRWMKPVQKLCYAAVLCAICVVLALLCKSLTFAIYLRFTIESLPLIIAGILLGPWWAFGCGIAADLLNTAVTYGVSSINPIITLGEGLIGLMAGLVFCYFFKRGNMILRLLVTTFSAHLVGNMLVKTIGIRIWYGTPYETLLIRIPNYILIGAVEFGILVILEKTKVFQRIGRQNIT